MELALSSDPGSFFSRWQGHWPPTPTPSPRQPQRAGLTALSKPWPAFLDQRHSTPAQTSLGLWGPGALVNARGDVPEEQEHRASHSLTVRGQRALHWELLPVLASAEGLHGSALPWLRRDRMLGELVEDRPPPG